MEFRKILCPTDFSEASYRGLARAVTLARPQEAEICLLHVTAADTIEPANARLDVLDAADRRAEVVKNLCAVMEEIIPREIRARPLLRCGDAAAEIVRAAREENVDLIVLTTHGAGAAEPGGLGDVATEVLRQAPCPTLTLNLLDDGHLAAPGGYNGRLSGAQLMGVRADIETPRPHALYLDGD